MEEKIILKNVRDNKGMFQVKKESIISFLDVKDLVNKKAWIVNSSNVKKDYQEKIGIYLETSLEINISVIDGDDYKVSKVVRIS